MRYIPITQADKEAMLRDIGVSSTDELFADIPPAVRLSRPLNLPGPRSEQEILADFRWITGKNANMIDNACFLGSGAYDHYIPALVDYFLQRGEFLTAYTPYQPEISQGTLQAIYEWQSLICELTAMDVANASMYDGASAMAESAVMALDLTGRKKVVIAKSVHPDYRAVVRTYLSGLDVELVEVGLAAGGAGVSCTDELAGVVDDRTAAVIIQTPNFFGNLESVRKVEQITHAKGALFLVGITDPYSLGLLEAPGNYGADIVAMECQAFGNPTSYGGPVCGVIATKQQFVRRIPGRIAGQTVDNRGQRAFVLTLQAREQHIRREKATSNICTNQALNALAASITMNWLGKEGLQVAAQQSLAKARFLHSEILKIDGWKPAFTGPFFHEFTVIAPVDVAKLNDHLLKTKQIIGGHAIAKHYPELGNAVTFCVTEKRTRAEIDRLIAGLKEVR